VTEAYFGKSLFAWWFLEISFVLNTLLNRVFLHLCRNFCPTILEVDMFNRWKSQKSRFLTKKATCFYQFPGPALPIVTLVMWLGARAHRGPWFFSQFIDSLIILAKKSQVFSIFLYNCAIIASLTINLSLKSYSIIKKNKFNDSNVLKCWILAKYLLNRTPPFAFDWGPHILRLAKKVGTS